MLIKPRSHYRILIGLTSPICKKKILDKLNTDGIAWISATDLAGKNQQLLTDLEVDYNQWISENEHQEHQSGGKDYEHKKHPKLNTLLAGNNPLLQLALSDEVLSIAKSYFNDNLKLFLANYWHTVISAKKTREASQNWHRDPEDKRILKIFLYLNDIGEENGAFEYVKHSANGQVHDQVYPQSLFISNYVEPQNNTIANTLKSNIVKANFPKYTILFADTTGFHRGGFATSGERKMAHLIFTSTFTPFDFMTVVDAKDKLIPKDKLPYLQPIQPLRTTVNAVAKSFYVSMSVPFFHESYLPKILKSIVLRNR